MKKIIYLILGFFVIILVMQAVSSWQLKKWQEALPRDISGELKSISSEQLQELYSPSENNYQEFISPDGKLKIKYPTGWLALKDQRFLKETVLEEWERKYNLKCLFLAQGLKAEKFAQLIINEGNFDMQIEEIIKEMVETNRQEGWEMEVIESNITKKEGTFEAKYLMPSGYNIYSKEKILLGEKKEGKTKAYLIAFIVPEKDWEEFTEEADFIINSARLNP